MKPIFIVFLFCFAFVLQAFPQKPSFNILEKGENLERPDTDSNRVEYVDDQFIRFRDYVYSDNIKTVRLFQEGLELSEPVMELNSAAKLHFCFDDLAGNVEDYYYTFVLCTHDWKPVDLDPMEYLDGFTENTFTDYNFSNSITDYTHYELQIPNEEIRMTKSGNYLLKVYLYGEKENPVITRRFYVIERKVEIEGRVLRPGLLNFYQTHQEVDFTIKHENLFINNAFNEINVVVRQNGRWDNAISSIDPKFVKNEQLVYDYNGQITFAGGKEFRYFDLRNLDFLKERVSDVQTIAGETHAFLAPDKNRAFIQYIYKKDINGKYIIAAENERNADIDAEYVTVRFTFPLEGPLTTGNVYVFGGLTDWNLLEAAKMKYNYNLKAYETQLKLKQGYFTYEYVFVQDGQGVFETSVLEGDSYETENDYTIFVYYSKPGNRYDELIGIETYNSLFGK